MKRIVSAGLMLATMSGAALAADLPARLPPPPPPPLPVFTWTGAYFGLNAGYAFDHKGDFHAYIDPSVFDDHEHVNSDGVAAGGQIGYNYQLGGFGGLGGTGGGIVVGVEADADYTDLFSKRTVNYPGLFDATVLYKSGLDFLGTVRGRVGYAFGQFLIYGTGGFAYGGIESSVTAVAPIPNAPLPVNFTAYGHRNHIETGYTYGGGIEYALPTNTFLNFFKSSAVTLKVEYLHYDLGHREIAIAPTIPGAHVKVSNEGDIVRAGLNYKFGTY